MRKKRNIFRRLLRRVIQLTLVAIAVVAGISILSVLFYRFAPPLMTPLMVIRLFDEQSLSRDIRREWRPLDEISPGVLRAVVAAEDMKFCDHSGFDWQAIDSAWEGYRNGAKGARLRGGSTITMQTAKNVFLWPSRSLFRKTVEAWFTLLIEALWSKDRILEVYVNVVEWGDGIYGVEAAAKHYFKRPAARLTDVQAARLAAVLPNPRIFAANGGTKYVTGRTRVILRRMGQVNLHGESVCP